MQARIMKDGFGKNWAVMPWGRVCISNYEEGPEYWARTMANQALEGALKSEEHYLDGVQSAQDFTPEVLCIMLKWVRATDRIIQGVM